MNFGFRCDVNLEEIVGSFTSVSGTIELALPYRLNDFMAQLHLLPTLQKFIVDNPSIVVQSIHATQGHITDPNFWYWSLPIVHLAEAVGAKYVVFHPENTSLEQKNNKQFEAIQKIKQLQSKTSVTIAIETFGNKKRILTPEEIIQKRLPMILDTAHLEHDRIMRILNEYSQGIVGVHLSELRQDEHPEHLGETNGHQPIKDFAFKVLDKLSEKEWDGIVTLEYMPWWREQLAKDREKLNKKYTTIEKMSQNRKN